MNRRDVIAGAALALLSRPALAQAPNAITIAGVPEESITPALWAQRSGIFRQAGLDVTIQPSNSGAAIAAGVAGGAYAAGKSGMVSIVLAYSHGLPVALVAPGGLYQAKNANVALVVRADSPIKTAADLNGKIVGVSGINDLTSIAAKAWTDSHGGDATTLKLVEFPFNVVVEGLVSGRIDAGGLAEPELHVAVESGKVRILGHFFDAIAPQFMYTGWFSTKTYLAANKAAAAAFSRAMRQSAAYVNGHQSETVDVLSKFTSVEASRISQMQRISYSVDLSPSLIQPVIEACARYKLIPTAFDARDMIAAL
jgi:NitT/TauT family transport system substrate-binding protein